MKKIFPRKAFVSFVSACLAWAAPILSAETVSVELGGNAYVTDGLGGADITNDGVRDWRNPAAVVSVFFSLEKPQKDVKIFLKARGNAEYEISCNGQKNSAEIVSDDAFVLVPAGTLNFDKAGYQRVDIFPKGKTGETFGEISELVLEGIDCEMNFVRDFDAYWGRRGPSVHMNYARPREKDIEYFYNEVIVPRGFDPLGTYFMVCGFSEGYFGIQVNSPMERRVLFSVWSPFNTDDPSEIPEDQRVSLLKKGEGVTVKDFGNEGAGGQSFLRYPWRAGKAYKFLVRVHPREDGSTDYTGWFFAPEENAWRLIASFRRPQTRTWLNGIHSFLENFNPRYGWNERRVAYLNTWVCDKEGVWHELTDGIFTCDGTGGANVRLDYEGGVSPDGKALVLRNCGFFNGPTPSYSAFRRDAQNQKPDIDFAALNALSD